VIALSSAAALAAHLASGSIDWAVALIFTVMDDFVPQVDEIISVGEFYEKAASGQIIFT
jgi:hypothetical protein